MSVSTVQFSPSAGVPTMMLPLISPQAWSCLVAQPYSAEIAAAGRAETAGQSEPCQATQKTQQASPGQAPTDTQQKCSASLHIPVLAQTPAMYALCPLGTDPLPMNHAAGPSGPSLEMNPTPLYSAIPLLHQPVVPVYQAAMQTPDSHHVVPVSTHQEGC